MVKSQDYNKIETRVQDKLGSLRHAQTQWKLLTVKERIKYLRPLREVIYAELKSLEESYQHPLRESFSETVAAELMPLVSAIDFLEKNAVSLLKTRTIPGSFTPMWLGKVHAEIHRVPLGVVLILGTWNYPIFLTGVQILQSLIAGNAVLIKPGEGAEEITRIMKSWLVKAGMPADLVQVLPDAVEYGQAAIKLGVNKIVMTGSSQSGRAVMKLASETLTPVTMELSGNDALIVLENADLELVIKSLLYGLQLNGGATCIAPRRVFIPETMKTKFLNILDSKLSDTRLHKINLAAWNKAVEVVRETLDQGGNLLYGTLVSYSTIDEIHVAGVVPLVLSNVAADAPVCQEDLFAPVVSIISYKNEAELLKLEEQCPYALGVSVFGDVKHAQNLATKLRAGQVCINDLIVPTADPNVPFGGTGHSGFGVTRGAEGLLELTRTQVITTRKDQWRPHLDPTTPYTLTILSLIMKILCLGGLGSQFKTYVQLAITGEYQKKWIKEQQEKDQVAS